MKIADAFPQLPPKLRTALLHEYGQITQSYLERRWSPAELSGGRFCEVVYNIIAGHITGNYPTDPKKPGDFVSACRKLEQEKNLPRSFQILIPRLLPALYEVRNNRNVGHIGGDVDPNHSDATFVISSCNWIMAELIRVLHALTIEEAQTLTDGLAENRHPLVWQGAETRRVLETNMNLRDHVLVLLGSCHEGANASDLQKWADYKNPRYFQKTLRELHDARMIEFNLQTGHVEILPPGVALMTKIISRYSLSLA